MKVSTLIITMTLALAFTARGQERDVSVATDIVTLNVAVRDANGKPVTGLVRGQFEVFDNEVKQTVEHFSHLSAGVTFGIVYDMHPTTSEQTKAVLSGLREFTSRLVEADEFFLVVFNERGSLSTNIIPDFDQLERHVANPGRREPRSLYDAIKLATAKLRTAKNLKRSLLVITDAADHNSQCSFNELRSTLGKLDLQVYAITPNENTPDFYDYKDLSPNQIILSDASPSDRAALNALARRSGGATFSTSLQHEGRVAEVLQRASEEMRNYYSISFYPTAPPDGKWHTLRVGFTNTPGKKQFVLTYRPGYQAGASRK